jgi:hypothetical protein
MVYHALGKVIWLSSSVRAGFVMLPNQEVEAKCKHNIPICSAFHHILTSSDRLNPSNHHGDFDTEICIQRDQTQRHTRTPSV